MTAGAHIYGSDDAPVRANDLGYVTSVAHSPSLGHMIGLGFVRNGPERRGQTVRLVDQMRGVQTLCVIGDPVFFDKDGGRVRG